MNYLMINVKLDYYYEYVVKVYSRNRRAAAQLDRGGPPCS